MITADLQRYTSLKERNDCRGNRLDVNADYDQHLLSEAVAFRLRTRTQTESSTTAAATPASELGISVLSEVSVGFRFPGRTAFFTAL